ncbi:unnamed protein product, partial [Mesorhabditis belari]|uniref:Uncharacterized protein n=1 Tax=Mesorhabditis belari TaxID=2138241 RepID=A0AAF3J9C4_9BILA
MAPNLSRETQAKDHKPQTLLTLAELLARIRDYRLASEVICCSASFSIQEFISDRRLNVRLHTDDVITSGFFTNDVDREDVNDGLKIANELIQQLQILELTDAKKKELEEGTFDD